LRRISILAALFCLLAACTDMVAPRDRAVQRPGSGLLGEVRRGFIVGRDGRPLEVRFEVRNGRAIYEGDIDLGPADAVPSTAQAVRPGGPRYGVVTEGYSGNGVLFRWPGGVVPYEIDPALPTPSRVTEAISAIEAANVGIRFVPHTTQADFVRVVTGTADCYSNVGRQGGMQLIRLASGCGTPQTTHEFGHALGMWHEQSRCDRSDYIVVDSANIIPQYLYAFDKVCDGASDIVEYDEGSLMHYTRYAFSSNGLPTMHSKRGRDALMDDHPALTSADIATLRALYPPGTAIHRLLNPTWYGGDHLYGPDPLEGKSAGYVLEAKNYFYLTSALSSAYATLYRCNVANHHFLSRDSYCEAGMPAEAGLGQLATTQIPGTVPLYRTRNPSTGHRLSTIDAGEAQGTINSGWTNEGVTGYVWVHIPITRLFNSGWSGGDHMYSHDPTEGRSSGYVIETQNYFFLTSVPGNGYSTLFRCNRNNHHFLSRDRNCESGVLAEAEMGNVATSPMTGTVALYRARSPWTGDRVSTISAGERQSLLSGGWIDEGVIGYVWNQP
jgi:hypothetical protein